MRIELTPEMENKINRQIANGYRSSEEVIKASLLLLRRHNEEKLEALRTELLPIIEQLKNGEGQLFDAEEIKKLGREKAQQERL